MAIELATKNSGVGISTIDLFFALLLSLYRIMCSICDERAAKEVVVSNPIYCILLAYSELSHHLELPSSKISGNKELIVHKSTLAASRS
jgi:hypothetical protein